MTLLHIGKPGFPFRLSEGPLFRLTVLMADFNRHVILFDSHAIATDIQARELLITQFWILYDGGAITPPRLEYKDYLIWYHEGETSKPTAAAKRFWSEQFAEPFGWLQTRFQSEPSAVEGFAISSEWTATDMVRIHAPLQRAGVTLHSMFLAAYAIAVGTVMDEYKYFVLSFLGDRDLDGLSEVVGTITRTIPIRIDLSIDRPFVELAKELQMFSARAYSHPGELGGDLYYERKAQVQSSLDILSPCFVFAEQRDPTAVGATQDRLGELVEGDRIRYPLRLECYQRLESLNVSLEYQKPYVTHLLARYLWRSWQFVLETAVQDPLRGVIDIQTGLRSVVARENNG